jgi:hypothetical protein
MSDRLITPPVGSAIFLVADTTPTSIGYAGTWQRRHIELFNLNSAKVLDVYGASTENGGNVDIWEPNYSKAQSWWLATVVADTTTSAGVLELWVRTA